MSTKSVLMILASHQTLSRHLTDQIKFDQSDIVINGKVIIKLLIEQVDVLPSKNQALCCKLNLLIYCHSMYCNKVT